MPDEFASPVPAAPISNLPPIVIPPGNPLVPDWAFEAVRRLNLITGATTAPVSGQGGYGAGAWAFSGANAKLMLPSGFTGTIQIGISGGSSNGYLQIQNGQIVIAQNPS